MQSSANNTNNNKSGQSFLEKFKGKTSKVSKQGLNNLLEKQYKSNNINQKHINQRQKHPIKFKDDQHLRKIDLDQIIPSQPKSKNSQPPVRKRQRTGGNIIKPQKQQYIPSSYTPSKNNTDISNSSPYQINKKLLIPPPSRSISQVTESFSQKGKSKYTFGKYLKLDQDALRHFQFLQQIEKKILINKSSMGSKVISR